MPNNGELVLELLKEVRDEQKSQSVILTEVQIDLAEHKEGVIQNRSVLAEHTKKITVLEEPSKAFKVIQKYVIGLGAMSGAIYGIKKFIAAFLP